MTSFVSMHGSKLILIKGSICGNLVSIPGRDTDVSDMFQEYLMCNGKEPMKLHRGGAFYATVMEFWTMEGYSVGF